MSSRDPEVIDLAQRTEELLRRAESVYADLTMHQNALAGFLERANDYAEKKERDARHR